MADIIEGDRPWKLSILENRLSTIERRINDAMDRVVQCAEQLKRVQPDDRRHQQQ